MKFPFNFLLSGWHALSKLSYIFVWSRRVFCLFIPASSKTARATIEQVQIASHSVVQTTWWNYVACQRGGRKGVGKSWILCRCWNTWLHLELYPCPGGGDTFTWCNERRRYICHRQVARSGCGCVVVNSLIWVDDQNQLVELDVFIIIL